jgi:hypothetical protein
MIAVPLWSTAANPGLLERLKNAYRRKEDQERRERR